MRPVPLSVLFVSIELELARLVALPDAMLARSPSNSVISAFGIEPVWHRTEVLDASQVESLPGTTNWTDVADLGQSGDETSQKQGLASGGPRVTVDGVRMESGFGGLRREGGSQLMPGASAISVILRSETGESPKLHLDHDSIEVATRRGTEHLHGQAFLFNRQRQFAAQNPSMQWVKESAPASGLTVPTFTGMPYTPSDVELRWGGAHGSGQYLPS